ncbi:CoA ester lyase [Palleronia sp. LCG004]|uniref:HpcH/HpaI aldolase/citrate lyase family protein n=1 Tax=Palleronia sp. LCG004 TaxID=3079304 RepID=UPI0029437BDE|nr:CoA ester lyase [Palleronia sp. LCG004]WOI56906.1 CoA ester lyase [Palleronia sp. LCG004]
MSKPRQSWRSVLYIPGSNARALEKARELPVDAIIFDLEDAVAPAEKENARKSLFAALNQGGYGERARIVRINGLDTRWGHDDLDEIADGSPDHILLPKVDGPGDVAALARELDARPATAGTRIWAMIETTRGVFSAAEIATSDRVAGLVIGTNDLAAEIGCDPGDDRMPLLMALQSCLAAARMAGIPCIDGVFNAFRDDDGLRAECEQGRRLGMDGKSLIHPAQIAICNDVFSPSAEEVDLARRRIAAHEEALAAGQGIAVLDGQIVESLHVNRARVTLARHEAAQRTA